MSCKSLVLGIMSYLFIITYCVNIYQGIASLFVHLFVHLFAAILQLIGRI